jgi:IS5 family transposase
MMRMLFVQHWFNLPDEAWEQVLYGSASLRSFVGIDLPRVRARRHDAAAVSASA